MENWVWILKQEGRQKNMNKKCTCTWRENSEEYDIKATVYNLIFLTEI